MVMCFYGWEPLTLGYHVANFGGFRHCGNGDKTSLICKRDIKRPHVQTAMWLYGWKPLKISHYPANFCGSRLCGSGDIMILVS